MKTFLILSAFVLLAVIVSENGMTQANPQRRQVQQASPAQKPGSCYRPGFGRKRRSVEDEEQFEAVELDDNSDADTYQAHLIEKRQVNSVYGGQGGNPWKPPAPTPSPYRCRNDFDCQSNKKCCSGTCQTPSFVG